MVAIVMWLNRTSAPAATPISVAEAKAHCRVLHSNDDTYIGMLVDAVAGMLDGRNGALGRALVTQSWEYRLDRFPCDGVIELPLPSLVSVASVAYVDQDGDIQTLSADDYVVDTATFVGQVRLAYGASWPDTRDEQHAVRITFTAGFGDAAAVPAPIRNAMLLIVAHLYSHREAATEIKLDTAPLSAKWLLAPYKMPKV